MGPDKKTPKEISALRKPAEAGLKSKAPEVQEFPSEKIGALVHELPVHQVELEMQNETLRQTQVALEEASEKYRDFYDFAPVGFLTLDESGMIREANLTAANQIGVTRSHLIDKPAGFSSKRRPRPLSPVPEADFREPGAAAL